MAEHQPAPVRLAVLISGSGRTLLNLQEYIAAGKLNARITKVISSRSNAAGVERVRAAGLPIIVLERRTLGEAEFQRQMNAQVQEADLICMAGFLSLWRIPDEL